MNNKRPGFTAYLPLIIVNILVFTAASLLFAVVLRDSSPVPFFTFFAFIQTSAITAFALIKRTTYYTITVFRKQSSRVRRNVFP